MRTKLIATIMVTLFLASLINMVSSVLPANASVSGGKFGNALEFDGVDDYVLIPDSSSLRLSSTEVTIEAWIYIPSNPVEGQFVIRKWIDADGGWGSYVLSAGDRISGYAGNKELQQYPTWTTMQTIAELGIEDKWAHVAFTWRKETATSGDGHIFVNGLSVATALEPRGYSEALTIGYGDYPLYFARKADAPSFSSNYFKGGLDEVRISNIARTSFNLTTPPSVDDNTVALWHFDEGTGYTVHDASANANHGTVSGATWTGIPTVTPAALVTATPTVTPNASGGFPMDFVFAIVAVIVIVIIAVAVYVYSKRR